IYVSLTGQGRVEVGLTTTYKATMSFFLLSPVPPFLIHLPYGLSGGGYVGYFLFLIVVILGSLIYLAIQTYREAREGKMESHQWSASRVSLSFFASLFISFTVAWLMSLLSRPVSAPRDFDILPNWLLLVELASASVYEELVARLLLIGVPLFLIALVSKRKGLHRYLLGGFNQWDGPTYFFVIFSSLLFGLAHSSGWGYWKIIPTFIGGLLFGYIFVRVGLHGAILMHFATDYLSSVTMLPSAPLPLHILGVLGMLGALFLSFVYGVHFLGETLDGMLRGGGKLIRILLLLSAPGAMVALLFATIYLGGGNLGGMMLFLLLIVFSFILILICLLFTNVDSGIVRALGVLFGVVGAFMTLIFAPLAIPYLIDKIKGLDREG
ncbi:MAG: CPBP family intramembrane metalloprotease, partial [Thermoplasmata archaeon]|nr:CPBP family intramembrane metalloprotease [Thermoplasmata archaeon]